jgi:hypothetical protein
MKIRWLLLLAAVFLLVMYIEEVPAQDGTTTITPMPGGHVVIQSPSGPTYCTWVGEHLVCR